MVGGTSISLQNLRVLESSVVRTENNRHTRLMVLARAKWPPGYKPRKGRKQTSTKGSFQRTLKKPQLCKQAKGRKIEVEGKAEEDKFNSTHSQLLVLIGEEQNTGPLIDRSLKTPKGKIQQGKPTYPETRKLLIIETAFNDNTVSHGQNQTDVENTHMREKISHARRSLKAGTRPSSQKPQIAKNLKTQKWKTARYTYSRRRYYAQCVYLGDWIGKMTAASAEKLAVAGGALLKYSPLWGKRKNFKRR